MKYAILPRIVNFGFIGIRSNVYAKINTMVKLFTFVVLYSFVLNHVENIALRQRHCMADIKNEENPCLIKNIIHDYELQN